MLKLSACLDGVSEWMRANRLQLNTSKTEVLWCATPRRQHQLPSTAIQIGTDLVSPSLSIRDLGIYINSDLSIRTHVTRTVAGCFAVLRQLRSIRCSVSDSVFWSLVVSLVMTRLDYRNATLASLPATQHCCLQSVLNAAARLIHNRRQSDHIMPPP